MRPAMLLSNPFPIRSVKRKTISSAAIPLQSRRPVRCSLKLRSIPKHRRSIKTFGSPAEITSVRALVSLWDSPTHFSLFVSCVVRTIDVVADVRK